MFREITTSAVYMGLLAAFVASLVRWRDKMIQPLLFFFAWHLFSIGTHGGLRPRFLATAMPALWLMGGVWVARIIEAWPGFMAQLQGYNKGQMRWGVWVVCLVAGVLTKR